MTRRDHGDLLASTQLARGYSDRLAKARHFDAVCLLGSVARGEAHPGSDVDLLLISLKPIRPSEVYEQLGKPDRISLITHTRESFGRLCHARAVFAIHVRDEGKILFDHHGWLTHRLAALVGVEADPEATYRWASREVERYRDLARFNGIYHFALARLYSISRAVAIGVTVQGGEAQYGKDEPFAWVASHHPDLEDSVSRLSALRPFREIEAGYDQFEPPFDDRGADSEIKQAVRDLDSLLAAASDPASDKPRDLRVHR